MVTCFHLSYYNNKLELYATHWVKQNESFYFLWKQYQNLRKKKNLENNPLFTRVGPSLILNGKVYTLESLIVKNRYIKIADPINLVSKAVTDGYKKLAHFWI